MQLNVPHRWLFVLFLLVAESVTAAPVPLEVNINKQYDDTTSVIYSRERVPLLHPDKKTPQRRSALEERAEISNAQLNLFRIENLDIRNGVLRDMMIKPITD